MARAVVVSFVWEESMRAVRVWKRLSCGGREREEVVS